MPYRIVLALLFALSLLPIAPVAAAAPPAAPPAQGLRMREVGGFGIVLYDTTTFSYGSLDSVPSGTARAGELVYLNGWQIGVYHIGENRWISQYAVVPLLDAAGTPLAGVAQAGASGATIYEAPGGKELGRYEAGTLFPVLKNEGEWTQVAFKRWVRTSESEALPERAWRAKLPPRLRPAAERFLASPSLTATKVYTQSVVPINYAGDLVDPNSVRYSRGEPVLATMRVTARYDWIVLRDGPSFDAKEIGRAWSNEIVTAYEVKGDWYRISDQWWAPRVWRGQLLLEPENVAAYAPAEYYNGGKWISIDLNRQQMTAWEGRDVVVGTRVKTGKYGYYTPAGVWKTYQKIPSARMSGGDYDLLDVAWTQYFTPSRIAIHAAYWHNNYNGRPGSHGCVNTPVEFAERLFHWAPLGTTVVTHNPYIFDAQDIADAQKWQMFDRSGP